MSKHFRKRIKNKDFTILCINCIGGCIYHRLGMEFRSPTINLIINAHDFVPFCLNLDHYLNQKVHFVPSEYNYPVGVLHGDENIGIPDVKIQFNHYNDEKEATEKWEHRKKRINKDNLYIIMYRWSGITAEELHMLDNYPCKNKVLLSKFPEPIVDWECYIKPQNKKTDTYLDKDIFGIRYIEKKYDFVSFLNKGVE